MPNSFYKVSFPIHERFYFDFVLDSLIMCRRLGLDSIGLSMCCSAAGRSRHIFGTKMVYQSVGGGADVFNPD